MNRVYVTQKEILDNHIATEYEHSCIFKIAAKKGLPCEGVLNPTPSVQYTVFRDCVTGDFVFQWGVI